MSASPPSGAPRPPRNASTVAIVRDGPSGLEVLLLQRAEKGDHNSGAWVFPGGLVDAGDRQAHRFCTGLDEAQASARLGLQEGGLDAYVAAIRECFEEAGLLLAVDAQGAPVSLEGERGARLAALRGPMAEGRHSLAELCESFGLRLAADRLFYVGHWLTPAGRAKRFDTRFFLAVLPPGQSSAHDAVETMDHVWLPPAVALAPENTRRLMTPTRATIEQIAAFADTAELLAWARSARSVTLVLPRLGLDAAGLRPVLPGEPAWAEIGRLDPQGRCDAWCELRPGVPVRLSGRVLRLPTEGARANSYVVGSADANACAVIDPASADAAHLDALLAAAPGPIGWILLTRGDPANTAAAAALKARTGALVHGPGDGAEPVLQGGQALAVAPGTTLRAIAQGACLQYLLVEEQTLFTGAAAPAAPPAGEAVEWLAPGAGFLSPAPPSSVESA